MPAPHRQAIAVAPGRGGTWIHDAVISAGGAITEPDEASGLVWTRSDRPDALAEMISQCPQLGWVQLPFAGVDPIAVLADAVDFVTIHILPYWEDEPVAIGQAIAHVEAIYAASGQLIPGKKLMIGETGWPTDGRMRNGHPPPHRGMHTQAGLIVQLAAFVGLAPAPPPSIRSSNDRWRRLVEPMHQRRLYQARAAAPTARPRLLKSLMLPFQVLHRQRWSRPWDDANAR